MVGLAGGSTSSNRALDGHDMWPMISQAADSPRREMLYGINPLPDGQAGAPKAGLRMGKYKLLCWGYAIKGIAGALANKCLNGGAGEFKHGPVLYDLDADPTESTNLAGEHPAQVQLMLGRLDELAAGSVYPMSWTAPYQGPEYYCKDCPLHPPSASPAEPWMSWI